MIREFIRGTVAAVHECLMQYRHHLDVVAVRAARPYGATVSLMLMLLEDERTSFASALRTAKSITGQRPGVRDTAAILRVLSKLQMVLLDHVDHLASGHHRQPDSEELEEYAPVLTRVIQLARFETSHGTNGARPLGDIMQQAIAEFGQPVPKRVQVLLMIAATRAILNGAHGQVYA